MKLLLPLFLLTASPATFASQCSTQTKGILATEGHRAIYRAFKAQLAPIQEKIKKGDMGMACALNKAYEIIEFCIKHSASRLNPDTVQKQAVCLLRSFGLAKDYDLNLDVCRIILEQKEQEQVALDNSSAPSEQVYQATMKILNSLKEKALDFDSDSDDDDENVLTILTVNIAIQEFHKSVHNRTYSIGQGSFDKTTLEAIKILKGLGLVNSNNRVIQSIREAVLEHEKQSTVVDQESSSSSSTQKK